MWVRLFYVTVPQSCVFRVFPTPQIAIKAEQHAILLLSDISSQFAFHRKLVSDYV